LPTQANSDVIKIRDAACLARLSMNHPDIAVAAEQSPAAERLQEKPIRPQLNTRQRLA